MVNSPLIRPYFLGGWHWGGYLRFPCWQEGNPRIGRVLGTPETGLPSFTSLVESEGTPPQKRGLLLGPPKGPYLQGKSISSPWADIIEKVNAEANPVVEPFASFCGLGFSWGTFSLVGYLPERDSSGMWFRQSHTGGDLLPSLHSLRCLPLTAPAGGIWCHRPERSRLVVCLWGPVLDHLQEDLAQFLEEEGPCCLQTVCFLAHHQSHEVPGPPFLGKPCPGECQKGPALLQDLPHGPQSGHQSGRTPIHFSPREEDGWNILDMINYPVMF